MHKELTSILYEQNLKATPQRLAILESIYNYGHINIDNLYEEVKIKFSSISQATIYKNINAMTKNMILYEVKLPNKKSVYEILKKKHSHLLCKKCGNINDAEVNLDNITSNLSNNYNFTINQYDLVVSGFCENCQDNI